MTKVILAGRTDLLDYFRTSGVFESSKLDYTPFLVFIESENSIQVQIISSSKELLTYPPETPVMGQWQGTWHSDFFQFTVGDYQRFLEATKPD